MTEGELLGFLIVFVLFCLFFTLAELKTIGNCFVLLEVSFKTGLGHLSSD